MTEPLEESKDSKPKRKPTPVFTDSDKVEMQDLYQGGGFTYRTLAERFETTAYQIRKIMSTSPVRHQTIEKEKGVRVSSRGVFQVDEPPPPKAGNLKKDMKLVRKQKIKKVQKKDEKPESSSEEESSEEEEEEDSSAESSEEEVKPKKRKGKGKSKGKVKGYDHLLEEFNESYAAIQAGSNHPTFIVLVRKQLDGLLKHDLVSKLDHSRYGGKISRCVEAKEKLAKKAKKATVKAKAKPKAAKVAAKGVEEVAEAPVAEMSDAEVMRAMGLI